MLRTVFIAARSAGSLCLGLCGYPIDLCCDQGNRANRFIHKHVVSFCLKTLSDVHLLYHRFVTIMLVQQYRMTGGEAVRCLAEQYGEAQFI